MRKPAVKRSPPYHVGDRVRILIPRFVVRVGYPKQVQDYVKEAESRTGSYLEAAMAEAGVRSHAWDSKQWKTMVREIAYLMARADGFGGKERSIHWVERPEYERATAYVRSVRTAHTGTYNAPWNYTSYDGEHDSDTGGLRNEVRHRLLTVNCFSKDPAVVERVLAERSEQMEPIAWGDWEIPTYHVERVEENRRPARIEVKP